MKRIHDLSPKALKLYKTAKNFKSITKRLFNEKADTKKRLKKAVLYSQSEEDILISTHETKPSGLQASTEGICLTITKNVDDFAESNSILLWNK